MPRATKKAVRRARRLPKRNRKGQFVRAKKRR